MQRDEMQPSLNEVANKQRGHIWRDRIVGALLALGIVVGAVAIESQARTMDAATTQAPAQSGERVALAK